MVRTIILHAVCFAVRRSQQFQSRSSLIRNFASTDKFRSRSFTKTIVSSKRGLAQNHRVVPFLSLSVDNLEKTKVDDTSAALDVDGLVIYDNYPGESQDEDSSLDALTELNTTDGNSCSGKEMIQSRAELLYKSLLQSAQSSLNNISKKTTSLQRELAKAQALEETMARANLILSNLYRLPHGTTSIEVEDWENDGKTVELVLNTKEYATAQEEADALFVLARKMKRGTKVVVELLKQSMEGEAILEEVLVDLLSMTRSEEGIHIDDIGEQTEIDEGALNLIKGRLERTSKTTGFQCPNLDELANPGGEQLRDKRRSNNNNSQRNTQSQPNPREFISPSGHKVLVGRNRRDNEAICFKISRPNDIWFHSRGCPGAHVLLCVRRGSPEVTNDDLQFSADLAVFYSDARTERKAPVTTAEPKHITKPRGAPLGAVTLRQEGKTLFGRPEMVSDDLKEAREMSGGAWDEMGYRKLGTRSRNKKRTTAVEKSTQEKKRQDANAKNKRKLRKEETD